MVLKLTFRVVLYLDRAFVYHSLLTVQFVVVGALVVALVIAIRLVDSTVQIIVYHHRHHHTTTESMAPTSANNNKNNNSGSVS